MVQIIAHYICNETPPAKMISLILDFFFKPQHYGISFVVTPFSQLPFFATRICSAPFVQTHVNYPIFTTTSLQQPKITTLPLYNQTFYHPHIYHTPFMQFQL